MKMEIKIRNQQKYTWLGNDNRKMYKKKTENYESNIFGEFYI